jgi:hypothetical protein
LAVYLRETQTFALTLVETVSDGVPASGAGRLENNGSIDRYTFTMPTAGEVYVDMISCRKNPKWSLIDSAGAVVEYYWCGDKSVSLPAGDYSLTVASVGYDAGTYSLK